MDLNFDGQYRDVYEKHYKEIIASFCDGKKVGEIAKELNDKYHVGISFQAVNYFYYNNKEYIDNCIKKHTNEKIDKIKELGAIEFCKDILKEYLFLLSEDLSQIVESLEPQEKAKLIVSVSNAISKLSGMEKSEINLNQMDLSSIFSDDLNWEG